LDLRTQFATETMLPTKHTKVNPIMNHFEFGRASDAENSAPVMTRGEADQKESQAAGRENHSEQPGTGILERACGRDNQRERKRRRRQAGDRDSHCSALLHLRHHVLEAFRVQHLRQTLLADLPANQIQQNDAQG